MIPQGGEDAIPQVHISAALRRLGPLNLDLTTERTDRLPDAQDTALNQPILISRDQLVQVQPNTTATHRRPSPSGLCQIISQLAHRLGRVKSLTFGAVPVGRLHGIGGTATYAHKPYRLVVGALPDRSGRHLFVLAAVVHSRATARDMRQYDAVVASLQPTR